MKGYTKLTDQQKQLFDKVHKRHLSAMGSGQRKQYSVDQIESIKWDGRVFKVHFKNGEWMNYTPSGQWH